MCAAATNYDLNGKKIKPKSKSVFSVFNRILSALSSKHQMSETDAETVNDLQISPNENIPTQLNSPGHSSPQADWMQMVQSQMNQSNPNATMIESQNIFSLNKCGNVHIGDTIHLQGSDSTSRIHRHSKYMKNRANKISKTDIGE